jgi:hypothetical protein
VGRRAVLVIPKADRPHPRHARNKAGSIDIAGSAAAPAAKCRNCRRGSFILNPPSLAVLFDHLVGAAEQCYRKAETGAPWPS